MVVYTLQQRWEILRYYFENLPTDFGRREASSAAYIRYPVKKVKETDILINKLKLENPKTVRIPENIAAVAESVCEAPSTSIHRRSHSRCIETLV